MRDWLIGERALKYFRRKKTKAIVTAIVAISLIFLFIAGIIFMSMFGYIPTNSTVQSGSASLRFSSPLNLTLCYIANASLDMADQVQLKVTSQNNGLLSYYFLDEKNYYIFSNPNSTTLSPKFIAQDVGKNLVFNTVINETGNYYLVLTGNTAEGTNATYSISVTKINSSNQFFFLLLSTGSIVGFIMIARSSSTKKRKQSTISDFSKINKLS